MKIKLFCMAGMSTSILVSKMKKIAEERGEEVEVNAYSVNAFEREVKDCDVALIGPQTGYVLEEKKKFADAENVPVAVIPMQAYGMADGGAVLDLAKKLIEDNK